MTVVAEAIPSTGEPLVPHANGDNWEIVGLLKFSGNYTTGGEAALATALEAILKQAGMGILEWVQVTGIPGFLFTFNYSTNKLQVFDTGASSGAALAELAEGAYPAGITGGSARVFAMGL